MSYKLVIALGGSVDLMARRLGPRLRPAARGGRCLARLSQPNAGPRGHFLDSFSEEHRQEKTKP
jgi:hypothetical protein